jgi:hypothetical protein
MANGDLALAAGFTPVAATKDIRLGYDDINRLADWVVTRYGRTASGNVPSTNTGVIAVTFPTGRFTAVPAVVANLNEYGEGAQVLVQSRSTTGCTILVYHVTTGFAIANLDVSWIAAQN